MAHIAGGLEAENELERVQALRAETVLWALLLLYMHRPPPLSPSSASSASSGSVHFLNIHPFTHHLLTHHRTKPRMYGCTATAPPPTSYSPPSSRSSPYTSPFRPSSSASLDALLALLPSPSSSASSPASASSSSTYARRSDGAGATFDEPHVPGVRPARGARRSV